MRDKHEQHQHQHPLPFFHISIAAAAAAATALGPRTPERRRAPLPRRRRHRCCCCYRSMVEFEMAHHLSCCRALQASRYEHEYELIRDGASSTTPSGRESTVAAGRVAAGRRRPTGTIRRRSSAVYSSYTSRASVLPGVVVLCIASSMVRGGMENARCI